jgi:hypothetical protein
MVIPTLIFIGANDFETKNLTRRESPNFECQLRYGGGHTLQVRCKAAAPGFDPTSAWHMYMRTFLCCAVPCTYRP